jgi:hypothetical protein
LLLGEMLFPPADSRRTTLSLLTWWESRRPTFNMVVGAVGVFTLVFVKLISLLPPGIPMPLGWEPVVLYGVLANVCYTFGWGFEAAAQRLWGEKCPRFGPALFRQGIAFSVGLTLLPVFLTSILWVGRALSLLFR